MKNLFTWSILLLALCANGQRYDNAWLFSSEVVCGLPDAACKGFGKGFVLTFEPTGLKFTPKSLKMDMEPANASICDKEGNLQFYTNGWFVRNYLGERIDNGDTLNQPTEPNDWPFVANKLNYGGDGVAYILPDADTSGVYYIFHQKGSSDFVAKGVGNFFKYLLVTKVDMRQNEGKGRVVNINKLLYRQPSNKAAYTRHGNGKYWWAVLPNLQPINYYVHLIDRDSILSTSVQKPDKSYPDSVISFTQKCFSLDGSLYADCNSSIGTRVFQFDRCTGKMTLYKQHILKAIGDQRYDLGPRGIAISPNNRFLYTCNADTLSQYDMEASDFVTSRVILHKGLPYRFTKGWNLNSSDTLGEFYRMSHGPDGKIYIVGDQLATDIYVIQQPNEKGMACQPCTKNCNSTPYFAAGIPIFPNYRLGALKGSPCDSIKVSNKDVETERYGLKLLPNPATDQVQVNLTVPEYAPGKKTDIVILNVVGEVVIKYPMPDFAYLATVDISSLASGVYAVQLRQRNQVMAVEKLVVVR